MKELYQEALERYLDLRRATLSPVTLRRYRTHLTSLIEFLQVHYPEVDSFAKLQRSPHIEAWLRSLANAEPPYTNNTRREFIFQARRFFHEIREWGWPESPPPELIRGDDFPRREHSLTPRRRIKALARRLGISCKGLQRDPWYRILERYVNSLNTTFHPASISGHRVPIVSLIEFLRTHFPQVDCPAKLRRTPHIEGWLEKLATAQPPYKASTLHQYIRHVQHFLENIRRWNWPDSPCHGLIRHDDLLPGPQLSRPRHRFNSLFATPSEDPPTETSCDKALRRYLDIRSATLRPSTVSGYRSRVSSLLWFLQVRFPEVDSFAKLRRSPHIEEWLQALARVQPPYTNDTRREFIRHVWRFLDDIREWGWPDSPPSGLIRRDDFPPPKRHLPKPLPQNLDAALIQGLHRDGDFVSLGLILARRTGLRIGELLRLELNCLIENPTGYSSIHVPIGKLRSERVIPIDTDTVELLKKIRKMRGQRPAIVDPETGRTLELLLCNGEGEFLSTNLFYQKLKSVANSVGITENVFPHRLRHSYATELIRNGVSLPGVMKLLGHKTIKMTLRYVEVTNEDLGRDYLKAIERVRQQYARLRQVCGSKTERHHEPLQAIRAAFDELVTLIQSFRFDHPDPRHRKRLQRFVERLRRAQGELPEILG